MLQKQSKSWSGQGNILRTDTGIICLKVEYHTLKILSKTCQNCPFSCWASISCSPSLVTGRIISNLQMNLPMNKQNNADHAVKEYIVFLLFWGHSFIGYWTSVWGYLHCFCSSTKILKHPLSGKYLNLKMRRSYTELIQE